MRLKICWKKKMQVNEFIAVLIEFERMCALHTYAYQGYSGACGVSAVYDAALDVRAQTERMRSAVLSLAEEVTPGNECENLLVSACVDRIRRSA